jgi:hypothetical protein
MAEMNLQEEQKHCTEVYKKWDFVRRIVDLYAEGVSWKGCDKLEVDAIKNGVRGMLVSGTGEFDLKTPVGAQVLSIPMPSEFPYEEPGHPFLWPATRNAKHLEEMVELLKLTSNAAEMVNMLVKDMCLGLGVPHWLLRPNASTADPTAIMWGLTTFRGKTDVLRNYISFRAKINWNENWLQHGLAAYGPIYQVFKAQGIELRTLAEQILHAAQSGLDSSLISKQTYEESVKWFR